MSPKKLEDRDDKEGKSTNSKRNSKGRPGKKLVVESNALEELDSETLDYGLFDERRSEQIIYAPRPKSYWARMARGLNLLIKMGNVGALWRLARLYEDGRGVKRNWKRMLELLEQGAEKGEPNATARLGLCYEYAIGVKYDPERAFEYYKKAANLADDFELVGLARGRLVAKKIEESTRFIILTENRKKGRRFGQIESTFAPNDSGNCDQILETLRQVQNSCSAYFFYRLSLLFSKLGRPDDIAQKISYGFIRRAAEIWHMEAELGNLTAGVCFAELVDLGFAEELREGEIDGILQDALDCKYAPGVTRVALRCEERGMSDFALSAYLNACESDWPDALCKAGVLEHNMLDDDEASFKHLQRGAELKHAPSVYFLGEYYWDDGKRQDRRKAVELFRQASEMDLGVAQERYAQHLNSDSRKLIDGRAKNPKEAFETYRRAADNGRELAKVAVACMLYEGEGVKQDCKQADKLFRQILKYGAPKTKETLAMRFLEKPTYEDKIDLAIQALEETSQELPSSCVVLGFCYYTGKHVKRDDRLAVEYFGKAAAGGEAVGAINFARCCLDGTGVKRNPVVAEYFLRLAASLGDPIAAFQLGELYSKGEGAPQNWRYAFEWYSLAVQHENHDAFAKLAECYWNGLGVERDYDKAIELWTTATSLDDSEASEDLERAKLARMAQKIFERNEVKKSCGSKRAEQTKKR